MRKRKNLLITAVLLIGIGFLMIAGIRNLPVFTPQNNASPVIPPAETDPPTTTSVPEKIDPPEMEAASACFWNVSTGQSLYEKDPDTPLAPASTTKLLTALTALDFCNPDETVTISDAVLLIADDASRVGLQIGRQMSLRDLMACMLLPSGNDAAYALAQCAGEKCREEEPVEGFVHRMNEKAHTLGAVSSNFVSPDGYDAENQYTTAHDLAIIASACLENPVIRAITPKASMTVRYTDGETFTIQNSNYLVHPDSPYYLPQAIGLKTGSTEQAGKCLVSAAVIDNRTYLCVVLNSTDTGRFEDSLKLYRSVQAEQQTPTE